MPRPLAIAFLACNKNPARYAQDASWLYRCDNLAQALADAGHEVVRTHWRWAPPRHFDLIVLHRPLLDARLRRQLRRWRRQGSRLIADFDDLVFRPELAALSPGVLNRVTPLPEMVQRFEAHHRALAEVDALTVSTAPLQAELQDALLLAGWQRPVMLLTNAVHHRWLGLPATDLSGGAPVVSYLPGTRSHDRDFAVAAPGLAACLRARPQAVLELTGPGDYPLDLPPAQQRRRPRLPFAMYPDVIRRARVNLLPLEATRFNRCKSALKVIEAGFWQVPTVCSPLPDADRFAGAGALFADAPAQWAEQLARLLDDTGHWRLQSQGLRERVLSRADVRRQVEPWLAWARAALC